MITFHYTYYQKIHNKFHDLNKDELHQEWIKFHQYHILGM
jgi:hypothetical protein